MTQREVESIYKSFRLEFMPYARKMVNGNAYLAEEAMQEALVRAVKVQDKFNDKYGRRGIHAWLLKILKNVCLELNRLPVGQSLDDPRFGGLDTPDNTTTEAVDTVAEQVEAKFIANYENSVVQEVIARTTLTNMEWAIVTGMRLGFTVAEIAPELGIQPNTVRAHYSNAMPKLRATAQEYGGCFDHRRSVQ